MTDPTNPSNRRDFLRNLSLTGAGLAALGPTALGAAGAAPSKFPATPAPAPAPAAKPVIAAKSAKPIVFGIIGSGGRGTELGVSIAGLPGAVVKYVCDVDEQRIKRAIEAIGKKQEAELKGVTDLHKVLEDGSVDAVAIATPDHWHAPATILACAAGKHVYVEKPCCHNPAEGEMMIAAARKHDRVVQQGTQRRSWPMNVEGIKRVHAGDIGDVKLSHGWYAADRGETGKRTKAPVPEGLDWNMWQGPAPRQEFTQNVVHYKWHWYWAWGTGEMGNNGIHALDLCRWGLGVDYARRVSAGGGRYFFRDDQETPDSMNVTFDFGDKAITWEGLSCIPRGPEGSSFGVAFYGEKGTILIDGGSYRILDLKGKEVESKTGPGGNNEHLQDFLDAIAQKRKPIADIEEAHKSVLLCHLANIALRTGRTLNCDPKTGHILDDKDAQAMWGRKYEKGWEPKV